MEKRALFAFVLSLLVLFGYQYLFQPVNRQEGISQQKEIDRVPDEIVEKASSEMAVKKAVSEDILSVDQLEEISGKLIRVETELAIYTVSTRDAVIKEIELKRYKDDRGENVRLVPEDTDIYPLQMLSDGQEFHVDYAHSVTSIILGEGKDSETLILGYKSSQGKTIEKRLTFHRDSYHVDVSIFQDLFDDYQLVVGSHFHQEGAKKKGGRYSHVGPVADVTGDIERINFKDIKERIVLAGEIPWIAFEDKYFMTSLLPDHQTTVAVVDRFERSDGTVFSFAITGKGETLAYQFYAGPKVYELLKSYHSGLEEVINFGFFGILGKPMFFILKAIYNVVHSYGIAIIILTSLIKIVFIPLTHKQHKSMQEMQKIQPKISALREKFKHDAQRMNKEVMALYKKYKVNPAAGCLPLIVQIPVFFALYNVLLNAIELRQASFLYISDLSAADTLFGHLGGFAVGPLPLLMGASMYIQQKMTPTTMDPKQARIFQYMPVIFTFMFLNFPSGLVLYWLVNNVLTIVQQFYINSKKKP
jgi:YidC/Oxa1 family membrane protein insertase